MAKRKTPKTVLRQVDIPRGKKSLYGGAPTVLVVEDEPMIQRNLINVMKKAGFHTMSATTPEEAVSMLARKNAHIDLLLADEHLPGMEGSELAEAAQSLDPSIKIMLIHGSSEVPIETLQREKTPRWEDEMIDQVSAML